MRKLVVVTGPMYAGKSTKLLDELDTFEDFLLFKPSQDDRYAEDEIATHDGKSRDCVVVPAEDGKRKMVRRVEEEQPDVIGIDEAQFFGDWLVDAVERMREDAAVVAAGLDEDFRGERFDTMMPFLEQADDIHWLQAECEQCGKKASKSQRLIDGEPAPYNSPTVLVGGEELYEARCKECHTVPGKPR